MRLAGENTQEDPEVFQTIWKHLKTDGVPDAEVTFRQLRKSGFWV